MRIMNAKETKKLQEIMINQFGDCIKGVFFISEKKKIYLTTIPARDTSRIIKNFSGIGLYIGRLNDDGFRPSIEGAQLLRPKKNIISLNEEQLKEWVAGYNIKVNEKDGYYIIRYNNETLGPGKVMNGHLWNYVPKERRIQNINE